MAVVDLSIVQGQDGDGVILPLVYPDGEPMAYDPEGWHCYSTVKNRGHVKLSRDSRVDPQTAAVIEREGGLALRILWNREDTNDWDFEKGQWDAWVIDPQGQHYKVCEGTVYVDLRVSDAS